ncbi:hypothetical protein [Streptomyces sp. ID38640]|uniref:hypothetical protein n=1 Tax=Streptomyces sp. ID38640 TaxID=1265399 RepID=UPI0037DA2621
MALLHTAAAAMASGAQHEGHHPLELMEGLVSEDADDPLEQQNHQCPQPERPAEQLGQRLTAEEADESHCMMPGRATPRPKASRESGS